MYTFSIKYNIIVYNFSIMTNNWTPSISYGITIKICLDVSYIYYQALRLSAVV